MEISRLELRKKIIEAVSELYDAPDKHNCGSDMVKVYINERAELYVVVQSSMYSNGDDEVIVSFRWSRPDYNTDQELLDQNEYTGTVAEWDWDNFTCGEDFNNYVEELLDKAIEMCYEHDIEVI